MKNLKETIQSLERRTFTELTDHHSIEKEFQLLSQKYKRKNLKEICKNEMNFWGFYVENGTFNPKCSWTDKDGNVVEYPSFENDFNTDSLEYFNGRTSKVINLQLKARYNHFLWQSEFKHRKYAISAIESYLKIIEVNDANSKGELLEISKSLLTISNESKYNIEFTNNRIKSLIENKQLKGFETSRLGDFILKQFKNKKVNQILEAVFNSNINYLENLKPSHFIITEICDTNIKIADKLNIDGKCFHIKKAEHYLYLIDSEESEHKQHFYFKAIQSYTEVGDTAKTDELYVLLENNKDEIRMGSFGEQFTNKEIQHIFEDIERRADKLTDLNSSKIYEFIAVNKTILPKAKSFYKKRESSFLDGCSTISFDINSNFTTNEQSDILNEYRMFLTNFSSRELYLIFEKGIIKNSLGFESLVKYLHEKTWIGKSYASKDYDGEVYNYCLLDTIFPSLLDFFNLFDSSLKNKRYIDTAYVLCIDSLVLKIEGLIRHFAKLIGCPTITMNKKKNGTRERYIEEIVAHEKFKEYLDDDDIVFILFVMTNKGMNIRNNVAHSFYRFENYSISVIILLITIVLRLSKFDTK